MKNILGQNAERSFSLVFREPVIITIWLWNSNMIDTAYLRVKRRMKISSVLMIWNNNTNDNYTVEMKRKTGWSFLSAVAIQKRTSYCTYKPTTTWWEWIHSLCFRSITRLWKWILMRSDIGCDLEGSVYRCRWLNLLANTQRKETLQDDCEIDLFNFSRFNYQHKGFREGRGIDPHGVAVPRGRAYG